FLVILATVSHTAPYSTLDKYVTVAMSEPKAPFVFLFILIPSAFNPHAPRKVIPCTLIVSVVMDDIFTVVFITHTHFGIDISISGRCVFKRHLAYGFALDVEQV